MDMPEAIMSDTLSQCAAVQKIAIRIPAPQSEWEDFLSLHELLGKILELQKPFNSCCWSRENNIAAFMQWLSENGVADASARVEFQNYGDSRTYGLRLKRDFECGETVFELPRSLVLTVTAVRKKLDPDLQRLFSRDSTLSAMPNIQLAVVVLNERFDRSSFWSQYFDVLPTCYETPLYFTTDQMQALRGTSAFTDALNMYRSIARQYAYLFRLFHDERIPLIRRFTFEAYRWAVATVTTRQNRVPDHSLRTPSELALIPLLDMCNHSQFVKQCTDYDEEQRRVRVLSHSDLKAGDELCIFYGPRSSAEFLVHNGFVPACDGRPLTNRYDKFTLQLGIAKADPNFDVRRKLLSQLGMASVALFTIALRTKASQVNGQADESTSSENGGSLSEEFVSDVDTSLLTFVRILSADLEQLQKLQAAIAAADSQSNRLVHWLKSPNLFRPDAQHQQESACWWKLDDRVWSFLKTRFELLSSALSRGRSDQKVVACDTDSVLHSIRLLKDSETAILSLAITECQAQLDAIAALLKDS